MTDAVPTVLPEMAIFQNYLVYVPCDVERKVASKGTETTIEFTHVKRGDSEIPFYRNYLPLQFVERVYQFLDKPLHAICILQEINADYCGFFLSVKSKLNTRLVTTRPNINVLQIQIPLNTKTNQSSVRCESVVQETIEEYVFDIDNNITTAFARDETHPTNTLNTFHLQLRSSSLRDIITYSLNFACRICENQRDPSRVFRLTNLMLAQLIDASGAALQFMYQIPVNGANRICLDVTQLKMENVIGLLFVQIFIVLMNQNVCALLTSNSDIKLNMSNRTNIIYMTDNDVGAQKYRSFFPYLLLVPHQIQTTLLGTTFRTMPYTSFELQALFFMAKQYRVMKPS